MKKAIKSFVMVFVLLALAIAPVLAGCSKTCTVTVSIEGGNFSGGQVRKENNTGSAYGKNAFAVGDTCKFVIEPNDGHHIESIEVNGEHYSGPFEADAAHTLNLKVEKDTSIHVTFAENYYAVTIYCVVKHTNGDGVTMIVGTTPYIWDTPVKHGTNIYFKELGTDGDGRGYVYYKRKNQPIVFVDPNVGVAINNHEQSIFYTALTYDEVVAKIEAYEQSHS